MNERITELMREAGMSFSSQTERIVSREEALKFAELIVKECASLFDPDLQDEHEEWVIRKSILNHFGVEE